jgi:hypothetical protein
VALAPSVVRERDSGMPQDDSMVPTMNLAGARPSLLDVDFSRAPFTVAW